MYSAKQKVVRRAVAGRNKYASKCLANVASRRRDTRVPDDCTGDREVSGTE